MLHKSRATQWNVFMCRPLPEVFITFFFLHCMYLLWGKMACHSSLTVFPCPNPNPNPNTDISKICNRPVVT